MKYQIVIAGFGGQGTVFLVKLLSLCSAAKNLNCLGTETHGMSQRGGTVVSFLKIGDVYSPLVGENQADLLLGLHPNEVLRFVQYLKKSGKLVSNGDNSFPEIDWPNMVVDGNKKSFDEKFPIQGLNVFMVGVVLGWVKEFPFSKKEIEQAIKEINPKAAKENLRILDLGYQSSKEKAGK